MADDFTRGPITPSGVAPGKTTAPMATSQTNRRRKSSISFFSLIQTQVSNFVGNSFCCFHRTLLFLFRIFFGRVFPRIFCTLRESWRIIEQKIIVKIWRGSFLPAFLPRFLFCSFPEVWCHRSVHVNLAEWWISLSKDFFFSTFQSLYGKRERREHATLAFRNRVFIPKCNKKKVVKR